MKAFERRLDKYWVDQDVKYDYEAPLRLGLVARANRTLNISVTSDSDTDLDIQDV